MVQDIYQQMGFGQVKENYYNLVVDEYQKKNVYIKEEI
jgi:hypothetical protein